MLHHLITFANSGCNVYANTLRILHLLVRTLPSPSLYFLSDILASILIPDDLVTTSVSVSKILSGVGTHSGLAVRMKSFLKTPTWNKAWLAVLKTMLPGWYTIIHVHWRTKQKKLGARKDSHPLDILNQKNLCFKQMIFSV